MLHFLYRQKNSVFGIYVTNGLLFGHEKKIFLSHRQFFFSVCRHIPAMRNFYIASVLLPLSKTFRYWQNHP